MLHARHNDAPRRGQAGNADRTFDASKQSPSYYSLNTASLLLLLKSNSLHFFYFLLSTLFNYTVRLMAPGMRVCKKKKITSARLNNYSPLFNHHHHHHQYITSNKKEKRNKNESSRYRLRETEIKLLPLLSCDYLQNRFDK